MKNISVPGQRQLNTESQLLLDPVKKRIGRIPNLFAVIGYSPVALKAFLEFDRILNEGVFTSQEKEAIALVVSEVNACEYCLAAHTVTSLGIGISIDDTFAFRRGQADDNKLRAIVELAKWMTENKGKRNEELLANFFAAGFNVVGLMELIGLVTLRIFTNYVFSTTSIPVDFPLAKPLV